METVLIILGIFGALGAVLWGVRGYLIGWLAQGGQPGPGSDGGGSDSGWSSDGNSRHHSGDGDSGGSDGGGSGD
jgi:hypothetical protein